MALEYLKKKKKKRIRMRGRDHRFRLVEVCKSG